MNRRSGGLTWTVALALLAGAAIQPAAAQTGMTGDAAGPADLILRNGRILDGAGNPWFRGDVAIRGERIVAVGDLGDLEAVRELDVSGLYVAPGFIDVHSHAGGGLATPELSHARPLLAQGVTTVVVNPDGGGPVDLAAQRGALEADGLGVNVAQMVPHGSVRRAVMGTEDRFAGPEELEEMAALVRTGMEEGAWGLSSGPFYVPGSYSDTRELVELARVTAPFGGVYSSHVRDESDYTIGVVAALDEVITVAREADVVGVHTHVKVLGPPVWGFSRALVHRIEQARRQGVEVYADQYPYPASATSLNAALLPRWAEAGGRDSLLARLARPDDGGRIRDAVVENLARRGGADRIQFRRVLWNAGLEGRRLDQVARERGSDPVDEALRIIREGGASIVSFNMNEQDVQTLMRQPWTMTASDGDLVPWQEGVPHPRSYGTFPWKIQHYVVEEGVVSLEEAVRSMTSLPARVFRMADRGMVEPGRVADLVVFDLEALGSPATFTDPHQLAEGVVHLWVGGRAAIEGGRFLNARAGRVLRKR